MAKESGKHDTLKTVAVAVSVAIIFRSFVFEPFHIPSSSMKDTLEIGDFLFVSKYTYGYSRYSLPLGLPLWEGRKMELSEPQRGDIIVFRPPNNLRIDYIKRLIGLPGDTVQMRGGVLHINGEAVKRERMEDYLETEFVGGNKTTRHVRRYQETLPNGVVHSTLDDIANGEVDDTPVYRVPEGHYFFMGDNRDHSSDSRYIDKVGFVPKENIVGRAEVVVASAYEDKSIFAVWDWPSTFRTGRFWKSLTNDIPAPEKAVADE